MAIEFHCECGQHFRVDQQHAGKRATCNACGRKLTIPQASTAAAAKSNGAASASKPADSHLPAAPVPAALSAADVQASEMLASAKEHEEDGFHHRAIEDLNVIVAMPSVSRA